MLAKILKFTAMASLLIWLKPRWQAIAVLLVAFLGIDWLHGEFLEYATVTEDKTFVAVSYLVKFLLLLLCAVLAYRIFVKSSQKPPLAKTAKIRKPAPREAKGKNDADDGFDFLRKKPRLMNKAEMVLTNSKEKE